jgi:hypothetical protein
MEEDKPLPESALEKNNNINIDSNNQPPEEVIPAEATALPNEEIISTEPQTANSTLQTEDMEVHHHTHAAHGKKTWKDYFWEFLMLFLAVFCGFLAEYQLEHKIERDRAKELAKNFYEELKNDSATAVIKVQNRIRQEEAIKYLVSYFKDSSLTNVPKKFALAFEFGILFRTPSIFEPRTIILEQLKNSGSLRYFKNEELQRLIGDLTVYIKNIYDRQELETQNRIDYINPIIINHYDYDFDAAIKKGGESIFDGIISYEKGNEDIPFHLNGLDKFDKQRAINVLQFYRSNVIQSTRIVFIQKYMEINAELLKLLRKEYDLK